MKKVILSAINVLFHSWSAALLAHQINLHSHGSSPDFIFAGALLSCIWVVVEGIWIEYLIAEL